MAAIPHSVGGFSLEEHFRNFTINAGANLEQPVLASEHGDHFEDNSETDDSEQVSEAASLSPPPPPPPPYQPPVYSHPEDHLIAIFKYDEQSNHYDVFQWAAAPNMLTEGEYNRPHREVVTILTNMSAVELRQIWIFIGRINTIEALERSNEAGHHEYYYWLIQSIRTLGNGDFSLVMTRYCTQMRNVG